MAFSHIPSNRICILELQLPLLLHLLHHTRFYRFRSLRFQAFGRFISLPTNHKLLTVYDYKNEATEAMIESSKKMEPNIVFGENPSGFSCLFVKKSSISVLNKSSTSIGVVSLIPTGNLFRQSTISETESKDQIVTLGMLFRREEAGLLSSSFSSSEEAFELQEVKEDGSKTQEEPSFSELLKSDKRVVSNDASPSGIRSSETIECRGLDHADEVGLIVISSRNRYHINWLVNALLCLRHPHSENGAALVKIYGPKISINRAPAVAFNVFDWKGDKIDPILVQKLADRNNVSLACGFLQHVWFENNYKEEKQKILEKENTERREVEHKKREVNLIRKFLCLSFCQVFDQL
nr:uncharacterized protein LOC113706224 [Coffea arabica]